MTNKESTDERDNEIRNEIFKATGIKVSVDDPIVQLIKIQQSFINDSYLVAAQDLTKVANDIKSDIDQHHQKSLEILVRKVNDLSDICSKIETDIAKSQEKKFNYHSIFYIVVGILCSSLAAYMVATYVKAL